MTKERWQKLSLIEQLANIGSEAQRVNHWQERGERANKEQAMKRALELIDLTLADQRWQNHRLKELSRLREVFCQAFSEKQEDQIYLPLLNNYFLDFALAARR